MADLTCSVPICGEPARCRGWCSSHYQRWQKTGDVQADRPIRAKIPSRAEAQCSIEDCTKTPDGGRGWCDMHYMRWRTHGDPMVNNRRLPQICSVPSCDRGVERRGLCQGHAARLERTGDVQADKPFVVGGWRPPKGTCLENGCDELVKARNLCSKHYWIMRGQEVQNDPTLVEARREYQRQWHAAWRERDPARVRAAYNEWTAANPRAAKAKYARRRSRKLNARSIPFTLEQLDERMAYWGDRCWMCSGPFEEIDHVKPLSKGGPHMLANLRPACKSCNSAKRDTWPFVVAR